MADLPYMPFYVDDFEGATVHLTLEEDGAYNRLLRLCWRQADCSIPDNPAWIMRMLRCDEATFERSVKPVLDEFFTASRGRISQKRQREEFAKAKDLLEKRRAAGRVGGKAKGRKQKDNQESKPSEVLEANPEQSLSEPQASRTRTRTITNTPPNGGVEATPPQRNFEGWERTLLSLADIQFTTLGLSPMGPMVQLQLDGFDLVREVLPVVEQDIARAKAQGRLNKLAWGTIAKKVREARLNGSTPGTPLAAAAAQPPQPWEKRLAFARTNQTWDSKWGPYPNTPGCLVPAHLVKPDDGKGWDEWAERAAS